MKTQFCFFRNFGILIGLVASSAAWAADAPKDCNSEKTFHEVSREELNQMVQAKQATVIDVNGKDSYQSHHVPGALHYDAIKKNFAQSLPADHSATVVAYCGGPMCNAWKKAATEACKLGYTNVLHFKGGIEGWVKGEAGGKS